MHPLSDIRSAMRMMAMLAHNCYRLARNCHSLVHNHHQCPPRLCLAVDACLGFENPVVVLQNSECAISSNPDSPWLKYFDAGLEIKSHEGPCFKEWDGGKNAETAPRVAIDRYHGFCARRVSHCYLP